MKIIEEGNRKLILHEKTDEMYTIGVQLRNMMFEIMDNNSYPKVISLEVRDLTDIDRRIFNYGEERKEVADEDDEQAQVPEESQKESP